MKTNSLFVAATMLLFTAASFSQDQGMTGETHRKNVGKILWAKERITKSIMDQVTYETVVDASDPLYGRVFLEKSLPRLSEEQGKDCYNQNCSFRLKVFVDGVDKGTINQSYLPDGQTWTTCQINLNLSPGDNADNGNGGVPEKWAELVKGLSNGTHECRFEFYGGDGDNCLKKVAGGSFTLKKTGEIAAGKLKKLPIAKKNDAALESSMIKAIKAKGWKNESPVKVVIVEGDWRIIRDLVGTILRREINTNVILKDNSGSCRLTDISFTQEHKGGDKYGATEVYGIGMKNIPFDCEAAR
jgi:hypothetical protein